MSFTHWKAVADALDISDRGLRGLRSRDDWPGPSRLPLSEADIEALKDWRSGLRPDRAADSRELWKPEPTAAPGPVRGLVDFLFGNHGPAKGMTLEYLVSHPPDEHRAEFDRLSLADLRRLVDLMNGNMKIVINFALGLPPDADPPPRPDSEWSAILNNIIDEHPESIAGAWGSALDDVLHDAGLLKRTRTRKDSPSCRK